MILRFPNSAKRTVCLHRMSGFAPPEDVRFKASFSEPTVVIARNPMGANDQRLRSALQPYLGTDVEIFDDLQFSVMDQSGR